MEWLYPDEVAPDIEGGYYHEQAHTNRANRRKYSEFTANILGRAAQAGGNWLLRKGFDKLKSMAYGKKKSSTPMESAKKRARSASGQAKGRVANGSGIKPAMFLSGRGAEIPLVLNSFQKPIRLSLGVKGPALTDARHALASSVTYGSKSVAVGFAMKAVKPYVVPINLDGAENSLARENTDNTFITTHVFRHKDPRVMSPTMGQNSKYWNYTLGPDLAFNRRAAGGADPSTYGTAFTPPTGFLPDFKSAERFPKSQHDMCPRYNVEANEQNSWNLNPMKVISSTIDESIGQQGYPVTTPPTIWVPRAQPMYTFANVIPPPVPLADTEQFGNQIFQSVPASQTCEFPAKWFSVPPINATWAVGQEPLIPPYNGPLSIGNPDGFYKVQSGEGELNYTFANNGTCAVVVDLVVTKLKEGSIIYDTNNFDGSGVNNRNAYWQGLKAQVQDGYNCQMKGLHSSTIMGGQNIDSNVPISDMKHEFLPKRFFKQGIAPSQPQPSSTTGDPASSVPGPKYKFIARDQFIIAPGATKPWRTKLPSMSYDARKYRNFNANAEDATGPPPQYDDVDADRPFPNRVVYDDRCYALSWRFSNVSVPVAEKNTDAALANTVAVISRGATDINVGVEGSYIEHPAPVFKVKGSKQMFNAGVLANPFYTNSTPYPKLSHIDIANSGQAVRTAGEETSYINLGATNSQAA